MATEGMTFIPPNLTKGEPRDPLHIWCRHCAAPVDHYTGVIEPDGTVSLTVNCHGLNVSLSFVSEEEYAAVTQACRWPASEAVNHSDTGTSPDWLALW